VTCGLQEAAGGGDGPQAAEDHPGLLHGAQEEDHRLGESGLLKHNFSFYADILSVFSKDKGKK